MKQRSKEDAVEATVPIQRNGNSIKWESQRGADPHFFDQKWEFNKMGIVGEFDRFLKMNKVLLNVHVFSKTC